MAPPRSVRPAEARGLLVSVLRTLDEITLERCTPAGPARTRVLTMAPRRGPDEERP
jgi:hypothetical protein